MSICLLVYVSLTLVCLPLSVSVGLYVCLPVRVFVGSLGWLVDRLVSVYFRMLVARSVILSTQTANIGKPDKQGSMTDRSMTDKSITDGSMTDRFMTV